MRFRQMGFWFLNEVQWALDTYGYIPEFALVYRKFDFNIFTWYGIVFSQLDLKKITLKKKFIFKLFEIQLNSSRVYFVVEKK